MWRTVPTDEVPQVLESLDLPGIAKYIQGDTCKNIVVMAGAGISTSAGIPDFRSPETGLYANLARLKLPYPEAVFDISFFKRNPRPFYTLAHELAPGKFRPTLTHSFIRLLSEKQRLLKCFTQNIDTLERRAGVPPPLIIEAHGSFADQHCIQCHSRYPRDKIVAQIAAQEIPYCMRCDGLVKPDIVFFGESLPESFMLGMRRLRDADLLIVMGTSLTVHPFASLTEMAPEECPRLLLNLDHVGGWGSRVNDVACLLPCDKAVRELCKLLGWEEELDRLWAKTAMDTKGESVGQSEKAKKGVPAAEKKDEVKEKATAVEEPKGDVLDNIMDKLAYTVGGVKLEDDVPKISEGAAEERKEKLDTADTTKEPEAKEDGHREPSASETASIPAVEDAVTNKGSTGNLEAHNPEKVQSSATVTTDRTSSP